MSRDAGAPSRRGSTAGSGPALRVRPRWHRVAGCMQVGVAAYLIIANLVMEFAEVPLLPLGHSPLWLFAGLVALSTAITWFGWMDRPNTLTPSRRR